MIFGKSMPHFSVGQWIEARTGHLALSKARWGQIQLLVRSQDTMNTTTSAAKTAAQKTGHSRVQLLYSGMELLGSKNGELEPKWSN